MIGLIKTILIIIGLWVVIQFFSRLMSSTDQHTGNSTSAKNTHRKNDNNKDDGEYIEYEEIK
ncbi:MAG: DUF4834 family protein [Flavobacteriales bacterium]|nr:DUF4834 family protein [Flavobacteriales bacterium]